MHQFEFKMQSYAANVILKRAKIVNWYTCSKTRCTTPYFGLTLTLGWRTYYMHFQNSKWKDFLGTTHSLLPHFFNFLCPTSAPILWRMCRYIHISDLVDYIGINVATKIILIVEHFYTYLVQCEVLTRYLTLVRWPGSDIRNWTFYNPCNIQVN